MQTERLVGNDLSYPELLRSGISALSHLIANVKPALSFLSDPAQTKKTLDIYASYPILKQKQIYEDFNKYYSIMNNTLNSSLPISNKTALWTALKLFGHPNGNDDLFMNIEETDVIEVYRYDGIQVFRNLNFHDICSYELAELFIYSWDELYYRNNEYVDLLSSAAQKAFSGKHRGVIPFEIESAHSIYELFSPKRFKINIAFKFFYPLCNKSGQVEYCVVISDTKVVESNYLQIDG